MDVENKKTIGGPNPGIIEVPTTRSLSSIGIVETPGITKTSARLHQRFKRRMLRQMLLLDQVTSE